MGYSFKIENKVFNWSELQVEQKLKAVADAEKDKQWIRSDLNVVGSYCLTRLFFKFCPSCLRRFFFHIDLEMSRKILTRLWPEVKDGRLSTIF